LVADMPNDFWSGWIITVTLIGFIGLLWLVVSIYTAPPGSAETVHATWDETLQEGNNPAPIWWFWMIFATMVFSVFYLMLYPGLGSFKGAFQWSQGAELKERQHNYNDKFNSTRNGIAHLPLEEIWSSKSLMATAENIFVRECAGCHGKDGQGQSNLFPNLRDNAWQWGGDPANIESSIRLGRSAFMPSWKDQIGQKDISEITKYVLNLSSSEEYVQKGRQHFASNCAVCHGIEGLGNQKIGVPSLADNVWLYGRDFNSVQNTIRKGQKGQMPRFQNRLDDMQIKLLTAWLTKK